MFYEDAMDKQYIQSQLYDYGYHLITPSKDAPKDEWMKLPWPGDVSLACAEYQRRYHQLLDRFTMRSPRDGGHARASIPDGDVGPATEMLFSLPRCGMPDYRMAGAEEANIPKSCRDQITMARNFEAFPGLTQQQTDEVFLIAARNWNQVIDCTISVKPNSEWRNTVFWAQLKRLSGSTLAYHYLARNLCNDRLEGSYDSDRRWSYGLAAAVATHEEGHGLGFQHTNGGTMNPYILDSAIDALGKPTDIDIAEAERQGYSKRTAPPEPPEPPHDDWDEMVQKVLDAMTIVVKDAGEWIPAPKTRM